MDNYQTSTGPLRVAGAGSRVMILLNFKVAP